MPLEQVCGKCCDALIQKDNEKYTLMVGYGGTLKCDVCGCIINPRKDEYYTWRPGEIQRLLGKKGKVESDHGSAD